MRGNELMYFTMYVLEIQMEIIYQWEREKSDVVDW